MGKYGPVVEGGRLRYLSASQLTSFDSGSYAGCERRWWFRNVARKPEGPTAATDLGTKVHAQLEHFLRTGEDVLGDVARMGRRFLPAPGGDLFIEYAFGELAGGKVVSLLTSAGVPFVGRIDLVHQRGEWVDDDGVVRSSPDEAEVVDWKTTSRIEDVLDESSGALRYRGYAKSGEELASTWQMVAYGMVALGMWSVGQVRSSHGYFQTRGPRAASKRSASCSASEVRERWSRSESLVERMKSAVNESDVERLPANYEACGAYGGCPHRTYCPRDGKLILAEALGRGGAMSILDKLKVGREATAKALSTLPSAAVAAEVAKLEAEEKALKVSRSATPPDMPAPTGVQIQDAAGMHRLCGTCEPTGRGAQTSGESMAVSGPCLYIGSQVELTIKEVASKKRACACGATVKIKPAEMGDKFFALIPKHDRPGAAAAVAEVKASSVTLASSVSDAKIKVSVVDDDGMKTPVASAPVTEAEPLSAESEQKLKAGIESAKRGEIRESPSFEPDLKYPLRVDLTRPTLTIYLDAVEDGVAPKRLESYAERLASALAEQYKAADIRCPPADSVLSFGKWKGALAALVRAEPPEPGDYAVSSLSELGMVAFEALVSKARVVRGVR